MELEHYPGMTERAIEAMIDTASSAFDIRARASSTASAALRPGDQIVLVVVAAAHRRRGIRTPASS